ncbi:glutathione S-transferase family protein [Aquabacterium sp. OR-4]|uniref:glutathione S-transferase family protein n=1 Tax=Aquabacterium sp. OR-4 TaxID=2978127 RepID=UPI0021B1E09F|nr:glutathione S-transferase family protein [Aquabacterium sp. OR-4]MDT7835192.1 glutathione S-transferase family protein [Aquabacterium sp. OR-4]
MNAQTLHPSSPSSSASSAGPAAVAAAAEHSSTIDAEFGFIRDPARRQLAPLAFGLRADSPPAVAWRAAQQRERLSFWDFPSSPFCVKVRAMLRHKGLVFEAVDPLAPAHWWTLQRRGLGKVPALQIDARFVTDSTDIALALEALYPEPALVPADARLAALNHALEEWADEALYFLGLHFLWLDPATAGLVPQLFGRGPLGRLGYQIYRRRIAAQVRGQGTGRKPPERLLGELQRQLDHAAALLQPGPWLIDEQPRLADFALFGQLSFLLRAVTSGPLVRERPPLMAFVKRLRAVGRDASATPR